MKVGSGKVIEKEKELGEIISDIELKLRMGKVIGDNSIDKIKILVTYGEELLKDNPDIVKLKQSQASINLSLKNAKKSGDNAKVKELVTLREMMGEEIRKQNKDQSMMSRIINAVYTKYDNRASTHDERTALQSKISAAKEYKAIMDEERGDAATKPKIAGLDGLIEQFDYMTVALTNMITRQAVKESKLVLFFDSPEKIEEAKVNGLVDSICSANKVQKKDISCWLSSDKVARTEAIIESRSRSGPKIYDLSENGNIAFFALKIEGNVGGSANFSSIAKFSKKVQVDKAIPIAEKDLKSQGYKLCAEYISGYSSYSGLRNNFTDYIILGDYKTDPLATSEVLQAMLNPESKLFKLMNDCQATPKDLETKLGKNWFKIANSIDITHSETRMWSQDGTMDFKGTKFDTILEEHDKPERIKTINTISEDVTKALFDENYANSAARVKDAVVIKEMITEALKDISSENLKTNQDMIEGAITYKVRQLTEPTKYGAALSYIRQDNNRIQLKENLEPVNKKQLITDLRETVKNIVDKESEKQTTKAGAKTTKYDAVAAAGPSSTPGIQMGAVVATKG